MLPLEMLELQMLQMLFLFMSKSALQKKLCFTSTRGKFSVAVVVAVVVARTAAKAVAAVLLGHYSSCSSRCSDYTHKAGWVMNRTFSYCLMNPKSSGSWLFWSRNQRSQALDKCFEQFSRAPARVRFARALQR